MSKIEKALNRAAADRKLVVAHPRAEQSADAQQLAVVGTTGLVDDASDNRSSETIARMQETSLRTPAELSTWGIISPEMGENAAIKPFRELRTKILQKTQGKNAVVMVTSVTHGSGASFVALNLSAAFAFDIGKTALLMDCNLQKQSLQRLFPEPDVSGLTDYLDDPEVDISKIIHAVGVERLRVIPVGARREKGSEYFTSGKMKRLIDALRTRYPERFVIVDGPPILESADTQILGDLCDYVILVVSYGTVTSSQLERAVKAIDRNKLLGVVFNNEPQLPRFGKAKQS